jgi:flagellar hook-associated protein FlgK
MKLYFNGCSVTAGDELTRPDLHAWPVLVANHYGVDFFNDALPGSSNDRTVRQAFINIDQYDKFYIQWTVNRRFMLRDTVNNWEVFFAPNYIEHYYKNIEHYQTFGKYYYAYWCNPVHNYINWLTQIVSLQSLFKAKNKPYVMFSARTNIAKPFPHHFEFITEKLLYHYLKDSKSAGSIDIKHTVNQINNLISNIDQTTFIEHGKFTGDAVYNPEIEQFILPGGHGDENYHQYLAKKVLQHENI